MCVNLHNMPPSNTCDFCGESFALEFTLKIHKVTHTGIKAGLCRVCKKWYSNEDQYKSHLKTHKSHVCEFCGKEYPHRGDLNVHKLSHKEKSFMCEICGGKFITKSSLNTHISKHLAYKPYQCHICNKRFQQKFNLKAHVANHEGIKRFRCSICPRETCTSDQLRVHMRSHAKRQNCAVCNKSYGSDTALKNHMQTVHSDLTPFECNVCEKKFPLKAALARHKRYMHLTKPHVCGICYKGFIFAFLLRQHIDKKHSQMPDSVQSGMEGTLIKTDYISDPSTVMERGNGSTVAQLELSNTTTNSGRAVPSIDLTIKYKPKTLRRMIKEQTSSSNVPAGSEQGTDLNNKPLGQCKVCKKWYYSAAFYEKHLASHKKYTCEKCGKCFYNSSVFNKHCLRHGERTHMCEHCNKAFKAPVFLREHIRRVHVNKPSIRIE